MVTPAITDNIVEAVEDVTTPVTKKSKTMTAAITDDIIEAVAVVTTHDREIFGGTTLDPTTPTKGRSIQLSWMKS